MKQRLPYILITIGLVGLFVQAIVRVETDRKILETQIKTQESSAIEGYKLKWRQFLLKKAKEDKVPKNYVLFWNRNGSDLRSIFFPRKKISLNWDEYREFVKKKQEDKIVAFLESALERNSSWDRILAIEEWYKKFGKYVKTESGYEETLVNSEAQDAYRQIFSQFAIGKDFTYAFDETHLDKVFFRIDGGSIEAFLPSSQVISTTLLPEFLQQNKITSAQLTSNPLELEIDKIATAKSEQTYAQLTILFFSLFISFLGIILFVLQIREHKKVLLRRVSFLNQVVHELKTPLTGLKLSLQLIQKGNNKEENYQALGYSLDRLNHLFDDVVLMNRPFEKITPEVVQATDLNKILSDLKSEFGDIKLTNSFTSSATVDIKRLRVVLRNLIKNAIRYGKVASVSITDNTSDISISVKDNGPGVPFGEKEKIFDEFYRSEHAKKVNADGLGLGLFLVKKLCEEMNAEISLVNPGEPGARFTMKILKGKK